MLSLTQILIHYSFISFYLFFYHYYYFFPSSIFSVNEIIIIIIKIDKKLGYDYNHEPFEKAAPPSLLHWLKQCRGARTMSCSG